MKISVKQKVYVFQLECLLLSSFRASSALFKGGPCIKIILDA